jgi:hypothetical protein
MAMFTIKRKPIRNGFLTKIKDRQREWGSVKTIAARIVVPDSMQWWYWQEFGTAVGGREGVTDPAGGASGHTYEIPGGNPYPVTFPGEDGKPVTAFVKAHPGVPSHHFVAKSLKDILLSAHQNFIESLHEGGYWSVASVKNALLERTMPAAIQRIGIEIAKELPNARPDGKLEGLHAYEVWESDSKIKDVSR